VYVRFNGDTVLVVNPVEVNPEYDVLDTILLIPK
jgi:hypothetical protein